MKLFAVVVVALGMLGIGAAVAQTAPATKPGLACCADKCKMMGNCCKLDAAGKTLCPMGGGCCVMPEATSPK